ncbi:MAG TPA: zf-HC2 domain-containing protein [Jiangellales bacterium]|nr:zf-HC2 domain-containing protein [Jiangellales bacterium]
MTPSAQQLTDALLLERTRAGDLSAFDALYRRHGSDARRVARIVSDNRRQADDIVAEAFARVLAKIRAGAGPTDVLMPYLRIVVRRLAVDRHRAGGSDERSADPALLDELPTADDGIAPRPDHDLVRAAFESLPERWQRVLWHTEIEGRAPASLVPALAGSSNAVDALAYRAREGLRQAFLAIHVAVSAPPLCRPYVPRLAAYIRRTLPHEEDVSVASHLDVCAPCRDRRDELLLLDSDVRSALVPALLGTITARGADATALVGAAALARTAAPEASDGRAAPADGSGQPRRFAQVAAASLLSVAAAAAIAFAAVSAIDPPDRSDDQVAAPPTAASQVESSAEPVTTDPPASETTGTPLEPPGRSEEPDGDEPSTEPDPLTQPPAESSQPNSAADDALSSPAEPESSSANRSGGDQQPANEPKAPPNQKTDSTTGSDGGRDNDDPRRPPPSPWMCDVLKPVLPWCN